MTEPGEVAVAASAFIQAARSLIGTPFVHQGHSASELDCVGLIFTAARIAGVPLECQPNFDKLRALLRWDYERVAKQSLLEQVSAFCTPCEELVPGCIMLFRLPGLRFEQHFAIYCGRKMLSGEEVETIVHADGALKRVVEHGYRGHWVRRTHSKYLLPGVAYGQ